MKRVPFFTLGILAVVTSAIAESPQPPPAPQPKEKPRTTPTPAPSTKPKAEREWKKFLANTRLKEGANRAEVEKRLQARVIEEFDRDHGFALFRDVYYELDADWCAYIFYRSPGGANITSDSPPGATRAVVPPKLLKNTPESRKYIQ